MHSPLFKRVLGITTAFAVLYAVADAQPQGPAGAGPEVVVQPEAPLFAPRSLHPSETEALEAAIKAARLGDRAGFDAARQALTEPVARKLAVWAFLDAQGDRLSFSELEPLRRDLTAWPRALRRQQWAEQSIETSSLDPAAIVQWFGDADPKTIDGVIALAAADQASGRPEAAAALIRRTWRTRPFDAGLQSRVLGRFGGLLTSEDHVQRAALLLYGSQGEALKDLVPLLPAEQQALVRARMALRADAGNALDLVAVLPAGLQADRGLVLEKAGYLRRKGQTDAALALAGALPPAPASDEAQSRAWTERRLLINAALKAQNYRAAYAAATNHGLTDSGDVADAEFYAGWLALSKLKDPQTADGHFARIQAVGGSPITQARAQYWRGRAHEAMGDRSGAQAFYAAGAKFYWTFYGQLAAERAGLAQIRLDADPVVTAQDRSRFEANELVQAARMLAAAGEIDLFNAFVLYIDDTLTSPADFAQLVDLAKTYGRQDLVMRVVRAAAQKGIVLPERGYPVRPAEPFAVAAAEPALVFGVTRQESGFDPKVRSAADARGMMQLLPGTAEIVARKIGVAYDASRLYDPDYNMRLGASFLGQLVDRFGGSYVMAIAGYNAGPGRLDDWISYCGDPRAPGADPLDFVECIPFSETRNYVMRVMEGMQVYRAKLNNGMAAPSLTADLKRGGAALAGAPGLQP